MEKLIRTALVGALATAAGALAVAGPAQADTCGRDVACRTTVTFEVIAGPLRITVPETAHLTVDGAPESYAYGYLGLVVVDDLRASATPNWTATVTGTGFTTGGGDAPGETITGGDVHYCSGTATTTGDGSFTPGQPDCAAPPPPAGESLDTPVVAYRHSDGTGNNSAAWNPLLTIDVPLDAVSGRYVGTVTHTVT